MAKSKTTKASNSQDPEQESKSAENITGYEEWRGEVKIERSEDGKEINRTFEKLKKLRPNVKISDDEAQTLNDAALYSPRQDYVIMYFKPE